MRDSVYVTVGYRIMSGFHYVVSSWFVFVDVHRLHALVACKMLIGPLLSE